MEHRSHGLWVVLKRYWMLWDFLWCSEVFWGIVRTSNSFHWCYIVLNALERFWGVFLRSSVTFCGIMWGILVLSHGSDRILKVWDILWRFWMLWGILVCSRGFWAILKDFWMFRSVILRCWVTRGIYMAFERFLKVSEAFSDLLECSILFRNVVMCSE